MKPIPAIDEAGEFVEAALRNGRRVYVFVLDDGEGDEYPIRTSSGIRTADGRVSPNGESALDIIDLPAVRERVERAAMARSYQHGKTRPMHPLNDSQRKPSFAEALHAQFALNRHHGTPLTWLTMEVAVMDAMRKAGE